MQIHSDVGRPFVIDGAEFPLSRHPFVTGVDHRGCPAEMGQRVVGRAAPDPQAELLYHLQICALNVYENFVLGYVS